MAARITKKGCVPKPTHNILIPHYSWDDAKRYMMDILEKCLRDGYISASTLTEGIPELDPQCPCDWIKWYKLQMFTYHEMPCVYTFEISGVTFLVSGMDCIILTTIHVKEG